MMSGMYAAISGLTAHQTMLDTVGNNLANVDTVGYKAERATFVDELAQLVKPASAGIPNLGGTNPMQIGLGTQLGSIDNMMAAGSLETTGNATDVAIQGDGFLVVQNGTPTSDPAQYTNPAGNPPFNATFSPSSTPVLYTRAGNLALTPFKDGGGTASYLTTQSGQYVLGTSAADGPLANTTNSPTDPNNLWVTGNAATPGATPIEIPAGATNVAISNNGQVTYTWTDGTQQTAGYIALATMTNEAGMQREGDSLWAPTVNSGQVTYGQPGTGNFGQTLSGQLEMSNVDMATEFTNMIQAQRGYQANAQTVSTADQMLQSVLQMKQG